jgi:hypothetical protein
MFDSDGTELEALFEGMLDGFIEGSRERDDEGVAEMEGIIFDGTGDGENDGVFDTDGPESEGFFEGFFDGIKDGELDGVDDKEGSFVGLLDGTMDGEEEANSAPTDGCSDGVLLGLSEGTEDGCTEAELDLDGFPEGFIEIDGVWALTVPNEPNNMMTKTIFETGMVAALISPPLYSLFFSFFRSNARFSTCLYV